MKSFPRPTVLTLALLTCLYGACTAARCEGKKTAPGVHSSQAGLKEVLAAYDAGNFQKAMTLCKQLLSTRPRDLAAHYVMGNICVKFNQISDAEAQYNYCLQAGKDSSEAAYATKALEQIQNQRNAQVASPASGIGQSWHSSASTGSTKGADQYIQEQTDTLMKEAKEKIEVKQRTLDDKIKVIQNDIQQQLAAVSAGASRGAANRAAKREAQDQIKEGAQHDIDLLKQAFERESEDINQSYQNRINSIAEHYHNVDSQGGSRGTGSR